MRKQITEYPLRKSDYGEVITLTATNGLEKHEFFIPSHNKEQGKK